MTVQTAPAMAAPRTRGRWIVRPLTCTECYEKIGVGEAACEVDRTWESTSITEPVGPLHRRCAETVVARLNT